MPATADRALVGAALGPGGGLAGRFGVPSGHLGLVEGVEGFDPVAEPAFAALRAAPEVAVVLEAMLPAPVREGARLGSSA